MRLPAAVLFIAAIAVTSADAADVTPACHAQPTCAARSAATLAIKPSKPAGRMPVRGIDHFVAVYGKSAASGDDKTSDVGEDAAALARADTSRG